MRCVTSSGVADMEPRLPLSVCYVSGAEAQRIGRSLASVASWAGEIIVLLNSEVADGTEGIAAGFGARVIREPWKGFIGQKNSVAAKCSQPWLLNLDADEVVTAELAKEIASIVASGNSPHAAYEFPRCTFYCGRWIRHGDWYPDRVCRLWRRDAAAWAGEEPHARLQVRGSIGRLGSDLQHFTSETLQRQVQKIIPYSDDFARQHPEASAGPVSFLFRPAWRWLRGYVFRLGFLDGWQGAYIAWMNAFAVATKYARVREKSATTKNTPADGVGR
jgi:glycosyltransferase involved in cell wall biosynthesis